MSRSLKNFAKDLLPPVILRLLRPASDYGWKGNYGSWNEALKNCTGYDAKNILEKVKEATLKVKNGQAAYERDSVTFGSIEYSWPLLSFLMWVATKNNGSLRIVDYGGALGSSYFQNKRFLVDLNVQWNIIEQPEYVKCGKEFIQDETIRFFSSLDESIKVKGLPDMLIVSCTLPYVEKPYDLLDEIMLHDIPFLVIDNTPFNYEQTDRISIQKVNPAIYDASYPCWFLNYNSIKTRLSKKYTIHTEYRNDLGISLDSHHIQYQGLLATLK